MELPIDQVWGQDVSCYNKEAVGAEDAKLICYRFRISRAEYCIDHRT